MPGDARKNLLSEAAAGLCRLIRVLWTAVGLEPDHTACAKHAEGAARGNLADKTVRIPLHRAPFVSSTRSDGTPGAGASLTAFLWSGSRLEMLTALKHYELSIPGGEKQG